MSGDRARLAERVGCVGALAPCERVFDNLDRRRIGHKPHGESGKAQCPPRRPAQLIWTKSASAVILTMVEPRGATSGRFVVLHATKAPSRQSSCSTPG